MKSQDDSHAVFATLADMTRVRVTDPTDWDHAQYQWNQLDRERRDRKFPDVRHFCVRSMDDPGWNTAKVSLGHSTPYEPSRGFKNVEDAARKAWKMWQGSKTNMGHEQGFGGWFYWHNGRPVCQGLKDLAKVCKSRGLVVQGVDGRWYPALAKD